MAKVRVYELAKELGVDSKVALTKLNDMGEYVRSASSTEEPPVAKRLRDAFAADASVAATPDAASTPAQKPTGKAAGKPQGKATAKPAGSK